MFTGLVLSALNKYKEKIRPYTPQVKKHTMDTRTIVRSKMIGKIRTIKSTCLVVERVRLNAFYKKNEVRYFFNIFDEVS